MKKLGLGVALVFIMLLGVLASGCLGGGNESPSETYSRSSGSGGGVTTSAGGAGGSSEEESRATWQTPWDAYNPVQIGGESYHITYIRYTFTIKSSEGERSYEVVKRRGYVKAHVYANDNGNKKDLGEYNLFAYYGKITPLNDPDMEGPLEYLILIKERMKDSDSYFLTPFPDFGAMMSGKTVIIEASYRGDYFYWSNPGAIGKYSELPYTEGDFDTMMERIPQATGQAWMLMITSGVWSGLENHDLTKPDEYSFSLMGIGYSYKIKPDGSVSLGGMDFRVSNVEWSWAVGGARGQGRATIAPELPIPVVSEGTFSQMGAGSFYSKLELKDLKLSREFEGINVEIEQTTSPGEGTETNTPTETQTETQTQTETPGGVSDNWQLAWDASKQIEVNGKDYLVREVTYEAEYHFSNGAQAQMTIKKGYLETELDGKKAYALYGIVNINGETYNYTIYVPPEYLEEYTSGTLWLPSVEGLVDGPEWFKIVITGPDCHYSMDESGNMEGDMTCGTIDEGFQEYNMIWTYGTGFYGGVYGDVVDVTSLTRNGNGYSIKKDGTVTLAGMEFETYNVTWSGIVQDIGIQANGETLVAPQLPFPVEVTASLTMPGAGGLYIHARLVDLRLEPAS